LAIPILGSPLQSFVRNELPLVLGALERILSLVRHGYFPGKITTVIDGSGPSYMWKEFVALDIVSVSSFISMMRDCDCDSGINPENPAGRKNTVLTWPFGLRNVTIDVLFFLGSMVMRLCGRDRRSSGKIDMLK